jgi:hypothetical protein
MKRVVVWLGMFLIALNAAAGFKAKTVRPKKPEKFQARAISSGITFAADLLLNGKDQMEFFFKELNASNVIAVRLAIFNGSNNEVVIALDDIQLIGPDGKEIMPVEPGVVAHAVLQGLPVGSATEQAPVQVTSTRRVRYSRTDPSDPGYDPRLDPTNPNYDPTDPRNTGYGRPHPDVQVILNPTGGQYSAISGQLIERDFIDKAYSADPIPASMARDKFIYYGLENRSSNTKGFELRLLKGKGISEPVMLKFP